MNLFTRGLIISLLVVGCLSTIVMAESVIENATAPPWQTLSANSQGSITNLGSTLSGLPIPLMHSVLAQQGFGDRLSSYAWSMAVFKGNLYVGTGQYVDTFDPMWEAVWPGISPNTHPVPLPDAPNVPFLQDWTWSSINGIPCVNDAAKFAQWKQGSYADIWQFSGKSRTWQRVFQGQDVPSYLLDATTKKMSYTASNAMGFRKMDVFTDDSGVSVLYAFVGGFSFALPAYGSLVYCSTDGIHWNSVPTPPQMGRETRASLCYNGRLYVGVNASGSSVPTALWCTEVDTDNPTNVHWEKVLDFSEKDPSNSGVISLASFNRKLYVGTQNTNGFQVWCGSGTPEVDDWVKVVTDGAVDHYNAWAGTMQVFKNRLYVGSISLPYLSGSSALKGFDLISIGTDNRWKLIIGGTMPALPVRGYENVRSASGLGSGCGNPMNFYCWSMEVYQNKLYLGTFDASVFFRYLKDYTGPLPSQIAALKSILPYLASGADLWETSDGVSWLPDSVNGFGDASNYGFRTMQVFDNKLIIGANNPFEGCQIHQLAPLLP